MWRLKINFTNGSSELVDEEFETRADAKAEFESWLENWGAGARALEEAGEDYCDYDIEDCEIWKE